MRKQSAPVEPVHLYAESVVQVPGPRERIWALLRDPASDVALNPACVGVRREPGSPIGLGEVVVADLVERGFRKQVRNRIIAFEEGTRLVAELIDHGSAIRQAAEIVIADAPGNEVEVVCAIWMQLPPGVPPDFVDQCQQAMDEQCRELTPRLVSYCRAEAPSSTKG